MLTMATIPEPVFSRGHRPTLTSTSVSTIGSLSKPRIRILLAPYMSPYVVPMKKVETWEQLLDLLSKLFGPSILTSILNITDTQGDVIHRHVWEDLLEPGMTIVVDTGSLNCRPGDEKNSGDGRGKEKEKAKQIQAALPFGQPPDPPTIVSKASPKPSQPRDVLKAGALKVQPEGKLPDDVIEQWAKDLPNSPDAEEKRITTVSMFIQQGMNGSRVTLGQINLDKDIEKMATHERKTMQGQKKIHTGDKPPVRLNRKKSTVARVADCFHGIKSRYGSSISKEDKTVQISGMGLINEITATPRKERQPEIPRSAGISAQSAAFATTSSGAISNQPVKPARRTASLKAFFRYFDDGKPVVVPRRAKSTPATPAVAKKGKESQSGPSEVIKRPKTAPPITLTSPEIRQRANTVGASGYISDGVATVSGALGRRATGDHLDAPVTARSPKPATPKPPVVDKPLPKLPYKFSTFPAPTPPRSPLIKAATKPPQPQPQQLSQAQLQTQVIVHTTSTPPPPTHKIIPWDELNRRLAKETQPASIGAQLRKSSVSAGISHRRGRSADSGYTMSGSEPLSFGVSRPTTAIVKNAEVAINGFGMKSKLVSVGKIGSQLPVPSKNAQERTMALGRTIRRVASDDTIRSGTGSWRLTNHRRAEIRRPQIAAGKGGAVGLGIDMSDDMPKVEPLEVQGGKTIAIGVIPED